MAVGEKRELQTFEEFKEDYEGFDWDNGEIIFIQKSNGANFVIWHKGGPWEVMAQKYFKNHVMSWKHTGNTMVIALDF